jgi:hypothetical protein
MCEVEAKTRRSIDTIVRSVPRLRRSVVNLPGGRYEVKEGRRVSGSERPRPRERLFFLVGPEAVAGLTPDGTVDMNQVQVAYIGNAGGGSGTLYYHGSSYPFTVGGLGVGGIGASTVDAEGEVYKLRNLSQFAGSYAQASYGFVVGTTSSGDLWMQNEAGVIMHLKAKRTGLMLSLGGDAVVINMQ